MSDFTSQQELMFYLASNEDNRVFKNPDKFMKGYLNGVLVCFHSDGTTAPSIDTFVNYQNYSKYIEPDWKEAINEKPIFAFFEYIDGKNNWSKLPVLIISYDAARNYPFAAYPTMTYKHIKPATKEEIEVYINNIPEV